jgi:hypothetical protein
MSFQESIMFTGNILDLTVQGDQHGTVLVAVDGLHQPGSTLTMRETDVPQIFLQALTMQWKKEDREHLEFHLSHNPFVEAVNRRGTSAVPQSPDKSANRNVLKSIRESLYSMDQLRKRPLEK